MPPVAILLAAGKSTRMKSAVPKVLHEIFGRPMIEYVLDATRKAGVERIVVIVGHQADMVKSALSGHSDIRFALQSEQKGTGHAVRMAAEALADHDGPALVLAGDTPLLQASSLSGLLEAQAARGAACVIGTAVTEANQGLGRIVRDASGEFLRIVEQKDATPEEAAIQEINTGCYAFDSRLLFQSLEQIRPNNKQGEYYLTDVPAILKSTGRTVVAASTFTMTEALGVNTRVQLAEARAAISKVTLDRLMTDGVTIIDPANTSIDPRASIGADTVIHPMTVIEGPVVIGANCHVGPLAHLSGAIQVADGESVRPFECRMAK
jgi:bifunctional UDP-N-acetylglucosamine pyrophosphorylase/glucosamine-1-phosphate N-acetyltransferase